MILIFFFFPVNAAALNKRDVSAGVQSCIDGLNTASAELLLVTSAVKGFTSAGGYSAAINIHTTEQTLESYLKSATTACCAVTTTVSEEDATAVIGVVDTIVPEIEDALSAIVAQKSQFDAVLLATALVKADIKSLQTELQSLDTCLLAVTPSDDAAVAQAYVDRITAAFATADTAYGITV